jgi:hypothetical protein
MPTFTIRLKDAIEFEPNIGLDEYPIFDEAYRPTLNKKILDHYWNQEIGQESISVFQLALKRKMNEIMPTYNQYYASERIKFDPMQTVKMNTLTATASKAVAAASSSTESESDAKSRAVAQEFPQVALAGNGDYASSAQDNISDTKATGTSTEDSTNSQDGTISGDVAGYSGVSSRLLMEFRQSFVNVDMMIITELDELFMQVWNNGDEYSERSGYAYGYLGLY